MSSRNQTKAKYRTPEYRRAYANLRAAQRAGVVLTCVEPVCLMASRDIQPWMRASVSHDTTGTVIIGPSHLRCNTSEGASRGNRARRKPRRLVL